MEQSKGRNRPVVANRQILTREAGPMLVANSVRWEKSIQPKHSPNELPAMEALMTLRRCRRGEEIYGREDPADYWYRVAWGMARKSTLLSDGHRRVVDFLLPGNYFGLSAGARRRNFDVEAVIEGTTVACFPRRHLEALADSDPEVGRFIRQVAFETLLRLQARILILGRTTAPEKVRAFLVEMGQRSREGGAEAVVLQMSRYDIADYLALSVETVSRALTRLKVLGAIVVADKHHLTIAGALEEAADPGME
jgi:CRP/FNR family nitrogen fixation transcriptional regulator